MSGSKIPARNIILEVEDDADTFVEIDGLNSVTVNPGENEETTDTTTYASDGAYEQQVMQRGATLELEGFMHKDDTGELDPGQARCEEMASKVGQESLSKVRFRHPDDDEWKVWTATFSLGGQGGGNNAMTSWACTITRSGKSTTETVA